MEFVQKFLKNKKSIVICLKITFQELYLYNYVTDDFVFTASTRIEFCAAVRFFDNDESPGPKNFPNWADNASKTIIVNR